MASDAARKGLIIICRALAGFLTLPTVLACSLLVHGVDVLTAWHAHPVQLFIVSRQGFILPPFCQYIRHRMAFGFAIQVFSQGIMGHACNDQFNQAFIVVLRQ